jgi:hypothetical protein
MKKGMLQTLEAIIGILSVLTVFALFFVQRVQLPEFETINWRNRGFAALKTLDENNELRQYVLANDTETIKNKLSEILPPNLNFEVVICELECGSIGIELEKLASVNYVIAGNLSSFSPRQIILYMW